MERTPKFHTLRRKSLKTLQFSLLSLTAEICQEKKF